MLGFLGSTLNWSLGCRLFIRECHCDQYLWKGGRSSGAKIAHQSFLYWAQRARPLYSSVNKSWLWAALEGAWPWARHCLYLRLIPRVLIAEDCLLTALPAAGVTNSFHERESRQCILTFTVGEAVSEEFWWKSPPSSYHSVSSIVVVCYWVQGLTTH